MKLTSILSAIVFTFVTGFAGAATPEEEKAFTEGYRKAVETKDLKALHSYLLTEGAPAVAVEAFKTMLSGDTDGTILSVELEEIDAKEMARLQANFPGPDGMTFKLPVKPYKKAVIKKEFKGPDATSHSTSSFPVAEKDGKIVIPLPVVVK